jgi:hypothetical protein
MPLRYWLMQLLIFAAAVFVHFLFGDPWRLPIASMVIVAIFGVLSRDTTIMK